MLEHWRLSKNLSINFGSGDIAVHGGEQFDWTVDLVDTGISTLTGGRIKRLAPYIGNSTFMLTWGDGVSDVNLDELLKFHKAHGKLATMTAVRPTARFGHLELDGEMIKNFSEKPQTQEGWINGAFFVLEPQIFDYIDGDDTQWEHKPLECLAKDGQLMAYKHSGFWQCMDTCATRNCLNHYGKKELHHGKSGENMRVMVTGSQGYMGSVLTPMLAAKRHDVVGFDSDLYRYCTFGNSMPKIPFICKDIRDVEIQDVKGFDAVLHLAGLSNDPLGDLNPDLTYEINHRASVRLAQMCKDAGVQRFIFSSSCSNYGTSPATRCSPSNQNSTL